MTTKPEFNQEVERIRSSGVLGTGSRIGRLFDFLVDRTLENAPPKESEIGATIFDRPTESMSEDSAPRVYVHRLRKKLTEFYDRSPREDGALLTIPKGEYRIVLETARPRSEPLERGFWRDRRALILLAAVGVLIAGNLLAWGLLSRTTRSVDHTFSDAPIWRGLTTGERPLIVVVGDYYLFGEFEDRLFLKRLIRDFSINSKDDLVRRYARSPELADKYGDVALQYLPVSAAYAFADLSALLSDRHTMVRLATQLTPNDIKSNDILYLGLISGLGPLRDTIFSRSRFIVGETYDEIIDQETRSTYTSEAFLAAPGDNMYRDYGLLQAFDGPSGNRIVVMAGARDTALMGMGESLSNSAFLEKMASTTEHNASVEILLEVRGQKHVNLEAQVVAWRRIDSEEIWSGAPGQNPIFPMQ